MKKRGVGGAGGRKNGKRGGIGREGAIGEGIGDFFLSFIGRFKKLLGSIVFFFLSSIAT